MTSALFPARTGVAEVADDQGRFLGTSGNGENKIQRSCRTRFSPRRSVESLPRELKTIRWENGADSPECQFTRNLFGEMICLLSLLSGSTSCTAGDYTFFDIGVDLYEDEDANQASC